MSAPTAVRERATAVLRELVAIPTTRGDEGDGMRRLHELIAPVVDRAELVAIDDELMDDPLYAFPVEGHTYAGTPNLECVIEGTGGGPPVVLNTHMDVVPPSEGQDDPWDPRLEDGTVHGRGACDAKGQIAVLHALAQLYRRDGPPPVDLVFHVVVEEEVGGNGTLAMVRRGVDGRAAVVLEPSELDVFAAVRGAVWFRLVTRGRAGHSGSGGTRVSAHDVAVEAMEVLTGYHDELLARSRGNDLFDVHDDPMPITFGRITAGAWPASIPAEATVEGVLGFLPNVDHPTVQREMRAALAGRGGWLADHFELTFPMLNNDGYALAPDHPLVTGLVDAARTRGADASVQAMTASCDAWLYNNLAGIPTVVFGAGSLGDAHGSGEKIRTDDVMTAALALRDLVAELA